MSIKTASFLLASKIITNTTTTTKLSNNIATSRKIKTTTTRLTNMAIMDGRFLGKFLIIFALICLTTNVTGRRHSPLPIDEPENNRRSNRPNSECQFGKSLREVGSTWFADLGPPFGVMYCIKCECVSVPRKRRLFARVQCRNIKKECPPALCDDPILLPGKCCKTCPGDKNDTDVASDVPAPINMEEEERNMKHFAALLTGRTSYFLKGEEMKAMYTTYNPHNIVATGRFLFHKKNLYYSFYTSGKFVRPRAIQFVDDAGTILEEHQLQSPHTKPQAATTLSTYQNATGKICGVWRRVPRDYKRLLRDERLHVVLIWGSKLQAELALAGKIARYTALQTELFSSLLEPAPGIKTDLLSGAGGTAIVSASSGAASSMHLTLVFNGVFTPDEYADVPVHVRLEVADRKDVIFDELQKVRKPSAEVNILELSSPISLQNLRLMSRGKLLITIESKHNPQLRIQGQIMTRASCELFQTLLVPHSAESTKTRSSGLAWVYLNNDGSLVYNIETDGVSTKDRPEISLIEDLGKRKTMLEDLSYSFNFNQALGTVDKLAPKVLESLYAGDLGVNVAIEHESSLIRGRLAPRPVADARDSAEPILLKRVDASNAPAHAMGMAWLAIDNECNLHYELTLNGFQAQSPDLQLYLEEKPIEAIGAPVTRKLLEEFNSSYLEGFVLDMPSNELVKLETSVCYLEIHAKEPKELLLRGKLKSTKVPSHCYPLYNDNNVPGSLLPGDHSGNHLITPETKCFHSGRFYDEAEQWRSTQDTCQMCACQHGRATCEAIKCPAAQCKPQEELVQREGECCPTCIPQVLVKEATAEQTKRGCRLGEQFHLAGATWHPFLPPNGFDTCTTCSCDALTLQVRCPRMVCPPLTCSDKLAYRPDKKACCKVCPEAKMSVRSDKSAASAGPANPNVLQDQAEHRSSARITDDLLTQGGCKVLNTIYENGQEWHPVLASHGEQKCIKCRCKDSKVNCDRKRCSRSLCQQTRVSAKRKVFEKHVSTTDAGAGAGAEGPDECCSTQCRRTRRHHKRNHQQERTERADDKQLPAKRQQSAMQHQHTTLSTRRS